jgi:tRNA threonylcarbamoyl adenosine modification protein (Sua5/YciO/YrdC/YwlC family)
VSEPGRDAETFERCMSVGGVAIFPADTVYGLACDVSDRLAVERLYRLKRRRPEKPSAVMLFSVEVAFAALPELGSLTRGALERLLPGAVTLLLPNPAERFPLACGADPSVVGIRVPVVPALAGVRWPVLQSSANFAGEPDARRLEDVPAELRRAADLVIDGGELPGTASTVIDLRSYEESGEWSIAREGAVPAAEVAAAMQGQFHFSPDSYMDMIRGDIPVYDRFQDELVAASGGGARRVLELGTGTGETAARLLERHPDALLVGVDESEGMLSAARERLPGDRVTLHVSRLQDPLPRGPFDLVASALCVHHLVGARKRSLFARVREALGPGGRFVLADVVTPADPADAVTSLTPGFDHPDTVDNQLSWLGEAGFAYAEVTWKHQDLAVIVAGLP